MSLRKQIKEVKSRIQKLGCGLLTAIVYEFFVGTHSNLKSYTVVMLQIWLSEKNVYWNTFYNRCLPMHK